MTTTTTTTTTGSTEWFRSLPVAYVDLPAARVAYRAVGEGPPLLCVHGWPFSNLSYRKIAPALAERFTCYLPDTPGLGLTEWRDATPFGFAGQAETLKAFASALGLERYKVLAHDTGATISRRIAQTDPRVERLVILNTEMPGHRPPWIPLYQRVTALPGSALSFQLLLRSRAYQRSPMGFGGCFVDRSRIDADFDDCFVRPLVRDRRRVEGVIRYLRGIDWDMVDGFATTHAEIRCPVLAIWGAADTTFPVQRAREMVRSMPTAERLHEVPGAALLVHEEKPDEVARAALPFLLA